ncbi:hypothetical protein ACFPFX_04305 [Streptomyces mauvecolor]|uniref:Uncharacterized protein n=1 Tax=Streptomyces mauvecolor TaxID=58345 RepID=A0ABV9UHD7_9ACTN
MSDCVLSYALTTVPAPLTVSPPKSGPGNEDELAYGSIDLVISNSGSTPVRCSRIAIVLPVGSLAQDLALTGEGIAPYVEPESGWTIVGPQPDVLLAVPTAETAVFPAAGETSKVRFSVEPTGGTSEVTVDGLYITLKNIAISNKTGVARIGIEEWATTGSTIPDVPNTGTLDVAKFPFRSGADPAPGVGRALVAVTSQGGPPATRIDSGAPVRLEWHHVRGDNHELYMDGRRVTDPSIPGGSVYPVPAGTVLRDTAFALKTVTPTPDGGFVTRWDHLTVCVTDQTLASLTVSGALTAKGAVTAEKTLDVAEAVTAKSTLGVTGNTTVGGTLGVTENTTVGGTLGVTGNTTVEGTLGVTRKLTAGNDVQVDGAATIGGSVFLNGAVGSGGTGSSIAVPGQVTFTAKTSGIVVGMAQSGSRYSSCVVTVSGGAGGDVRTTACADNDPKSQHHVQMSSATAFVRKGATVTVKAEHQTSSDGGWNYLYAYYRWIPFGNISSLSGSESSPESLSDEPSSGTA